MRPEPDTFLMVNRGVAYSDGRVFRGTRDAHVVAINAADGRQLWDVAIGDPKSGESAPLSPIAWDGLVFAGVPLYYLCRRAFAEHAVTPS